MDVARQTLYLLDSEGNEIRRYPISTSRYGTGCRNGSHKTPTGLHRIKSKIGGSMPIYEVFKGRLPRGNLHRLQAEGVALPDDVITSRILWLEGMEPGINQGGQIDSCNRYIYIHGTSDEALIGTPASAGCVRMLNKDVVELYQLVETGTEVNIVDEQPQIS
jgi:lipoprotein-anchoring transpeptidase ErfK/SrfK